MKTPVSAGFALAIALSACSSSQQHQAATSAKQVYGSAPAVAKDTYLSAAVATKLATVDVNSATTVHASAKNGVVTLTGQARTAKERADYERTASSVAGVVSVRDRLTVNPHLRGLRQQTSDATLGIRVAAAIAAQAGMNVFHVTSSSHAGTVTLQGAVPSRSIERTIVDAVRKVSGVRAVVDHLTIHS